MIEPISDLRLQDAANAIGSSVIHTLSEETFRDVEGLLSVEQMNELADRIDEAALEGLRDLLWRHVREQDDPMIAVRASGANDADGEESDDDNWTAATLTGER